MQNLATWNVVAIASMMAIAVLVIAALALWGRYLLKRDARNADTD